MEIIYYICLLILMPLMLVFVLYCLRFKAVENFINVSPIDKQGINRYVLLKAKEAIDELHIPFFLSSSTCLGYMREKNFIEHDQSIDIGIYSTDYDPQIINLLESKGLQCHNVAGSIQDGLKLTFYLSIPKYNKILINIYVYTDNGSTVCWYSGSTQKCVSTFTLKEIDFLGGKFNIPEPATQYLEERYGKTWRIPKYTCDSYPKRPSII